MSDEVLAVLEEKIDELLIHYHNLKSDHKRLLNQHKELRHRYDTLQKNHNFAIQGIESMINKLKKIRQDNE